MSSERVVGNWRLVFGTWEQAVLRSYGLKICTRDEESGFTQRLGLLPRKLQIPPKQCPVSFIPLSCRGKRARLSQRERVENSEFKNKISPTKAAFLLLTAFYNIAVSGRNHLQISIRSPYQMWVHQKLPTRKKKSRRFARYSSLVQYFQPVALFLKSSQLDLRVSCPWYSWSIRRALISLTTS